MTNKGLVALVILLAIWGGVSQNRLNNSARDHQQCDVAAQQEYHRGLVRGGKVALEANNEFTGYQQASVRGGCEEVFAASECGSCHK